MVTCIEGSGLVWTIIQGLNAQTGSLYLSLMLVMISLIFVCLLFRISIEWSAIFIVPFNLALMSCDSTFTAAGGVLLIYLGVILGKNFFFR